MLWTETAEESDANYPGFFFIRDLLFIWAIMMKNCLAIMNWSVRIRLGINLLLIWNDFLVNFSWDQ